jgi:hypothetical protein
MVANAGLMCATFGATYGQRFRQINDLSPRMSRMLSKYSSPVIGRAVVLADGLIAGCGTTIVSAAAADVSPNAIVGVIDIFASFANVRGSMLQTEFRSPEAGWREPRTPFHRSWRALSSARPVRASARRHLISGCAPGG